MHAYSSGLLIKKKSSRLDISELRNYFTKIKLITSRSKWTGPYNNERMKYNKIRFKKRLETIELLFINFKYSMPYVCFSCI